MSTRVTGAVKINAACQQLLRDRLSLPMDARIDLSDLDAILQMPIEVPVLTELMTSAPISATLHALAPDAYKTASALVSGLTEAGNSQTLISVAQASMAEAISQAAMAITSTTRDITSDAFTAAGAELGYTIEVCRGQAATGIELRRAHELILLQINDGGLVESDHAGLMDATCGDRQRELEQAVARRGVSLSHRDQQDHGNAEGGKLIKVAAGRHDPSLARAAALAAEDSQLRHEPARTRLPSVSRPDEFRRQRRIGGAR